MKRSVVLLLFFFVTLVFITGCWNRRELNDLAIAVGMGIDKSGDQYLVTAQVVDPGEVAAKGGSGRAPVTTYQQTGKTVLEALRKMTTLAPRKIYASHLRMLVIGESLAKDGMAKVLDLLSRDQELRTDFYIVVAKGTKAENILKILSPLEKIPANKMFSSLETSEKLWAPTVSITLDELISDLTSEGKQSALTGIRIKGSQEQGEMKKNVEEIDALGRLQYAGIAVFKKDKLVGWLNETESKGYTDLTDKLDGTILNVPCTKGGNVGIEVIRSKTDVKGKVKNGKPKVEVKIQTEANVAEVECGHLDLKKTKTIYDLETKLEKEVKDHCEASIRKAKKLGTDIFGFGEAVHRGAPRYWKKNKKHWDKNFIDLPVEIKVEAKIRRIGTIGNSFLEDVKK
ncbi:Ger(x)C family spore germination protein [Aneurinibacillus migulanus]|uniref:Spore germination protein KC n=1 Tax=Aneurinibacillus migulanus TaxID=47500 RepID=A0A0D1V621_ANEMI|nr:Ger(x)C family spore germination protein [Aneurinibacillus migulanus]KIV54819.1 spore gernimation protein GerC [Aneurinibacillus migulanus]KON95543.1 spore gernimation protein GerC [Aneurinibacillus migulanus]MED0892078.1 Ger(x)C family spore germination protein [Aneurinibacillus migulanus]MED1618687.1 Ger(x)C family spore germination protein [Aneurinibacillus migulanus]SDJ07912.1 spore germination protein KC [Aneurinibacillus migulanus]